VLFVSALPQVLKERVFAFEDSDGQLHIIFLVNDILFERLRQSSASSTVACTLSGNFTTGPATMQ